MANWQEAEFSGFFPSGVRQTLDNLTTLNSQFAGFLGTLQGYLEVAQALAGLASVDPIEATLRTVVESIQELIDGLADNTTAHALIIPLQKQYFGVGDPIPPNELDPYSTTLSFDQLAKDNSYPQAVLNAITPDTISFINNSPTAQGGNAGYYKELVLSLQDPGDFAKPDFPSTHAVTGVSIIYGSENLTDMHRVATLLNRVFKLGVRSDFTSRTRPVAGNLRSKIRPLPTEGTIGVQLTWDVVPPVLIKPLFSAQRIVNAEIFVIRSTSSVIRQRFTWEENFPNQPTDSQSDLPTNGETQVIARLTNDGFRNSYTDTNLDVNTPYYYAIAIRYKVDGVFQPMGPFSNVVRVFYNGIPASSRASEPPDWFATPSLIQMFPVIQTTISRVNLFISSMLNRTSSNSGAFNIIQQTINQITYLLSEAERLDSELNELTSLLQSIVNSDTTGIYATTFSVSSGGMQGWTSELARRLSDTSDSTRPPFDNGELVEGIVLVAGAPNPANLAGYQLLLDLLFPSGESNPLRDAVAQFPDPPDAGTLEFDDGLNPTRVATPTVVVDKPVFDANMNPVEKLDDC